MSIVHSYFGNTGILGGTAYRDAESRDPRFSGQRSRLLAAPFWLAAILVSTAAATIGSVIGLLPGPTAVALPLAIGFIWLVAEHPKIGYWLLLLGVPLTAGLGRNTIVPYFRPNEAVLALVSVALLIAYLSHPRPRPFSGLDLAIAFFAAAATLIPWAVLFLSHTNMDVDLWFTCLSPIQGLLVYLIFSRAEMSRRDVNVAFYCVGAVSLVVAWVGFAQLMNLPGVRDFLLNHYSGAGEAARYCTASTCRPTSLLEHYSSFGGFGVLNYAIALALLTVRHPAFPKRWLLTVMIVNALAVLASQTQADLVGIGLVTVMILWNQRRVPKELGPMALALIIGGILLWPQVHSRLEQQLMGGNASVTSPESLQTRILYWNQFFIPILRDHIWFGTGTVISTEVPARLSVYVDNEYIRLGFRAGVGGFVLFLLMLATIVSVGLHHSQRADPTARTLGLLAFTYAVTLATMGLTAEYFSFAGVSQQFWAICGLLAASSVSLNAARNTSEQTPQSNRGIVLIRSTGY